MAKKRDNEEEKIGRRNLFRKVGLTAAGAFLFSQAGAAVGRANDLITYKGSFFIYDPSNKDHVEAYKEAMMAIGRSREADGATEPLVRKFMQEMSFRLVPPLVVQGKDTAEILGMISGGALGSRMTRPFSSLVRDELEDNKITRRRFLKPVAVGLALTAGGTVLGGAAGKVSGTITDSQRQYDYVVYDPSNEKHAIAFKESIAAVDKARDEARRDGKSFGYAQVIGQFTEEMHHRIETRVLELGMTDGTTKSALLWSAGGAVIGYVGGSLAREMGR